MERKTASGERGFTVRRVAEPPYIIDDSKLRRYDQRNLIFNRVYGDPNWAGYMRAEEEQGLRNIAEGRPGYTRLDYALAEASWTVHDVWIDAFSWERLPRPRGPSLVGEEGFRVRYEVEDEAEMTRRLKRAARFYGASLVGVAELDRRWLYANKRYDLEPLELPEEVRNVVVMVIEMDAAEIATSPACPAAAATGLGYSRMAFTASCLAEFIRNLGYTAIPAGNDTGLSIPLAIDAGLGQLGRNGLLITPEYGPRVRLCKVFTDLPLQPDAPIDFGVTDFCRRCRLCAEACEAGAISEEPEPSWEPACRSNNPGALKWYVDSEKCYEFWCDNGGDCSTCIAVCPYNPGPKQASAEMFWEDEK
ncbi:reductive dehalogenase [Candidatus Bathyarchaeota archaeon]|nr:MAG: reductive dehalogenase [Candidatus Bathyarchaeota archaeon]